MVEVPVAFMLVNLVAGILLLWCVYEMDVMERKIARWKGRIHELERAAQAHDHMNRTLLNAHTQVINQALRSPRKSR